MPASDYSTVDDSKKDQYARFYYVEGSEPLVPEQRIYNTLIDMMRDRGYDVSEYSVYSPNKGDDYWIIKGYHYTRYIGQDREKVFVYFIREMPFRRIKTDIIANHVGCRMLLIFFEKQPNYNDVEYYRQYYHKNGLYIEIFEARRLVYNVTKHFLVPKHIVLSEDQKAVVLRDLRVKEYELYTISLDDPVAKYFGMLEGYIAMIVRASENSGRFVNYRICVDK